MSKLLDTARARRGRRGPQTGRLARVRVAGVERRGAAAVEFALLLPVLLVLLLGIIDFGLYFYSDLQLKQTARDAVRYLSLGDETHASAIVKGMTDYPPPQTSVSGVITPGPSLDQCSVRLTGVYSCLTPLPRFIGIDQNLSIVASATMREAK